MYLFFFIDPLVEWVFGKWYVFCLFEDRDSGHCTTSNHPYQIRCRFLGWVPSVLGLKRDPSGLGGAGSKFTLVPICDLGTGLGMDMVPKVGWQKYAEAILWIPSSFDNPSPQDKNILPKTHTREQANRPSWWVQFKYQFCFSTQNDTNSSKTHNLGSRKGFATQSTNDTQKPAYDQKTHPRHPKKRFSQKTRSDILPSVVTLMVAISGKTKSRAWNLAATLLP